VGRNSKDGWSERGEAFLPRLESDTDQSQFAKLMGFAKGSSHRASASESGAPENVESLPPAGGVVIRVADEKCIRDVFEIVIGDWRKDWPVNVGGSRRKYLTERRHSQSTEFAVFKDLWNSRGLGVNEELPAQNYSGLCVGWWNASDIISIPK
jgi:hypothetical protein